MSDYIDKSKFFIFKELDFGGDHRGLKEIKLNSISIEHFYEYVGFKALGFKYKFDEFDLDFETTGFSKDQKTIDKELKKLEKRINNHYKFRNYYVCKKIENNIDIYYVFKNKEDAVCFSLKNR